MQWRRDQLAIGKCNVALVVGARLNWLLHFGEPPKWAKDVNFVLIDNHPWVEAIAKKAKQNVSRMEAQWTTPMKIIRDVILELSSPAPILPSSRLDCWNMGVGLGYCIAAAVASPRLVVAVEGDSGFGSVPWKLSWDFVFASSSYFGESQLFSKAVVKKKHYAESNHLSSKG
ncbi:unnamed protein product [Ilex paraguariensis]|uniref:Thiamine pyrophosphate enzyme TPP-binding domain-containing protein n=1 Tax=Ilex paraguariensis TaxID=185542 RepID=A0ABC8R4T4_9AQUA